MRDETRDTGRRDFDTILVINAQVAQCARSILLHTDRCRCKKRDERRNTPGRCNRNLVLDMIAQKGECARSIVLHAD